MSIRSGLQYNIKDDYIKGFEDYGEHLGGRENTLAFKVLVFMLSGLLNE